jgi:hypothetical protein
MKRQLDTFVVQQRIIDGFFNLTDLLNNWNAFNGTKKELFEMERQIAMLINDGFLKNKEQVIQYLRKKYTEKYVPKCLRQ